MNRPTKSDPIADVERMKRGMLIFRQRLVEQREALVAERARIDSALAEIARIEALDGARISTSAKPEDT